MKSFENESMRKWFETKPSEAKRKICKGIIVKRISKINAIGDAEIEEYVGRVMANMSEEMLSDLEQALELYAKKIKEKVEKLLAEHEARTFELWMEQGSDSETKGDHLDNAESEAEARTGAEWANAAGRLYKYYMVFETRKPGYPGAYSYDDFMNIVKDL